MRHLYLLVAIGLAVQTAPAEARTSDPPGLVARMVWVAPVEVSTPTASISLDQPRDPWFSQDKALHFGASFLITLSQQYFLENRMDLPRDQAWPVSAGTALSLGLFKEVADSQRERSPLFSWRDMTWNAAGVGAALAVILL